MSSHKGPFVPGKGELISDQCCVPPPSRHLPPRHTPSDLDEIDGKQDERGRTNRESHASGSIFCSKLDSRSRGNKLWAFAGAHGSEKFFAGMFVKQFHGNRRGVGACDRAGERRELGRQTVLSFRTVPCSQQTSQEDARNGILGA